MSVPTVRPESPNSKRRVLILGAGPTAMGALHRLLQLRQQKLLPPELDICVLEREQHVGGLASTVTDSAGFSWDLGVHVMGRSNCAEFVRAVGGCVDEWHVVPRCAMVDLSHVFEQYGDDEQSPASSSSASPSFPLSRHPCFCYVPYPVQHSVPHFPSALRSLCLSELSSAFPPNSLPSPSDHSDFDSFSLRLFGPSLQRIFIRPYNEKVWTVKLRELSTQWLHGRVPPIIDADELARRCALGQMELAEEERKRRGAFWYPAKCKGIGDMWYRFALKFNAEMFKMNQRIVGIDPKEKIVRSENENGQKREWPFDVLISTLPLTELAKMSEGLMGGAEGALRHSVVMLVGIGLRGGQSPFARQLSWAYYPRPETVFYRCTVLSNFSPDLVPRQQQTADGEEGNGSNAFWSVLCEIGRESGKDGLEDEGETVERVLEDLCRVGIVQRGISKVCSRWTRTLPYGYPIPSLKRDEALAKCHEMLEKHQIYSRGRFGGWRYEVSNQDHSFQCGIELIDRIFLGIPETLYTSTVAERKEKCDDR